MAGERDRNRDREEDKDGETVKCPVCAEELESGRINAHLDECLQQHTEQEPPAKRLRPGGTGGTGVFSLFTNKTKDPQTPQRDKEPLLGTDKANTSFTSTNTSSTVTTSNTSSSTSSAPGLSLESLLTVEKPLAEKLRPTTLEEYFGQNKVVGEQTLLRSLLQSQEIPSLIFWGPPGCGKVWS